ncbi:MAG TPA: hypothetical protein VF993_06845 [Myxococcales bacterium]
MTKQILPLALLGALAACGGSISSTADLAANAPTYDKLALSQSDADMTAPAAAPSGSDTIQQNATVADCSPHLFDRSHEIVSRVNRHFFKHLRHVEELIRDNPKLVSAGTATWESVKDGIDRKLTITATVNSDGSTTYSFELDIKSTGAFVKVMDGAITRKGKAPALVETSGTVNFDFSALHSVIATELATGQIQSDFDIVKDPSKPAPGEKRTATVKLIAFLPEEGDPHGPRTGQYVWEREPAIGGSFAFEDTRVLFCPSNPTNAAANLIVVARWYNAAGGSVHGRGDAQATDGQIPAGDKWMGVTCAQGQTTSQPAEGYWMVKEEDAGGITIEGQSATLGTAPCDTLLGGTPPSVSDNSHDFAFSSVSFSAPYPFPNQW